MRFDDFELDEDNAQLMRAGRPVPLPPKAFAVLCALARQPGRLTRKDDLLDAVWGHRHVSESVLKTTISQLRAALEDDAARPRYIETASRLGYRFIGRMAQAPVAEPKYSEPTPATDCAPAAPMVGRKAVLARLHAAWNRAGGGQHQLFWIAGDAGVGKTTLIESFVRDLRAPVMAHGQCVEQYGAGEAYLPVLQALGSLARSFPEMPAMMRAVAPSWFLQMPWLASEGERATLGRELAGTGHERMVGELRELIERFTADRLLLLVTEDLHWSDHATLRLMDHFARRRGSVKVLWLASFRLTQIVAEGHPLQTLRHELKLHRLCEEALLDSFSESEVAEYLANRMPGAQVPESFVRRLHRHTDGLPLFVANVVDTMTQPDAADVRVVDWMHASTHTSLPVPEDLAGTLAKQIERLPFETRTLLEAASACGTEFQIKTVADVLDQDRLVVAGRCDELVRRQYWLRHESVLDLPDGTFDARYAFRHAIYKHAFYQRLGPAQRVHIHRRIAQSLTNDRATGRPSVSPVELAFHHEQGREYPMALSHYAKAAELALSQFAPKEAQELTEHALALLPRMAESPERLELELALVAHLGTARSQVHGISSDEARVALERAQAVCELLPQTPQRALLLTGLGWTMYVRGEYAQAQALGARVHALSVAHNNPVLLVSACNLLGMVCATRGEHLTACDWLERGIAARTALGDRLPLAAFLIDPAVTMRSILGIALVARGLPDRARAQAAAAMAHAQQIGHSMARAFSLRCATMVEIRLKDPQRAAEHVAALGKIIESTGVVQPVPPYFWMRGWSEAQLGEPQIGLRHALEGYERQVRMGMVAGRAEALICIAETLVLLSDWDGAGVRIDEALKLCERLGEGAYLPDLKLLQARVALGRGDAAAARARLREALQVSRSQEALDSELHALVELCELDERDPADMGTLAAAYARATEGFDTRICTRARELLAATPTPAT